MVQPIRPQDVTNVYRQQAASNARAGRADAEGSAGAGARALARRSDRVQLSDEALQLRRVLDSIAEHPELREERIAELRTQIEGGTYDRGFTQVASRLLDEGLLA